MITLHIRSGQKPLHRDLTASIPGAASAMATGINNHGDVVEPTLMPWGPCMLSAERGARQCVRFPYATAVTEHDLPGHQHL